MGVSKLAAVLPGLILCVCEQQPVLVCEVEAAGLKDLMDQ